MPNLLDRLVGDGTLVRGGGGRFAVGGADTKSQIVKFRATPGPRITVTLPKREVADA